MSVEFAARRRQLAPPASYDADGALPKFWASVTRR